MKKIIYIFVALSLTTLCYANGDGKHHHATVPKRKRPAVQKVSRYDAIVCDGPANVMIQDVGRQKHYRISGIDPKQADISAKLRKRTLYIDDDALSATPRVITLTTGALRSITVADGCRMRGRHVRSYGGLTITSRDSGSLNLTGVLNVTKIVMTGSGTIKLRWVNSHKLHIYNAGSGLISLAGVADYVYARVYNTGRLDAKYLRAQNVLIQTQNSARADVLAVDSLNAFAGQRSNIYYYKWSSHQLTHARFSGNVLPMAFWN